MNSYLPKDVIKFCPKCGTNKFKYNSSHNSFLCSSCNFNLFINSAAAVAAIVINGKGEIMLVRRGVNPSKGMLDLPGGFVDVLESAENAIARELREELDVEILNLEYFASYPNRYIYSEYTVYTTDLVFICKVDRTENLKAVDDIDEVNFYSADSIILEEIAFPSIREAVRRYIEEKC